MEGRLLQTAILCSSSRDFPQQEQETQHSGITGLHAVPQVSQLNETSFSSALEDKLCYAYGTEKCARALKDNEVAVNFTQINLNFPALV